ncbi:MAG: DUF5368 family protein [Rhodospirillales bacterium]|nr:DUF5368 family protein [Rhodospirillales bacterium]
MNDFNPVVLFFIVKESLADLFWPLSAVALLLLAGIAVAAARARARGRFGRAVAVSALVLIVVALALVPLMPLWSGVGTAALGSWLDVLFAFAFALVPAALLAALVFIGTGFGRGGRRMRKPLRSF